MTKIEQTQVNSTNPSQMKACTIIFIIGLVIVGLYLFMISGSPFSLMLKTDFLWNFPDYRLANLWRFIRWLGLAVLYIVCIVWLYRNKKLTKNNIKLVCYILTPFAILFFLISFIFGKPYAHSVTCSILMGGGEQYNKQIEADIWEKVYWDKNEEENACKIKPNIARP